MVRIVSLDLLKLKCQLVYAKWNVYSLIER